MLITATEPAVLGQPGVGPLDDPADRQLDEPLVILGPGNDNHLTPGLPLLNVLGEAGLPVGGVGVDGVDVRVLAGLQPLEAGDPPSPVRYVACRDDQRQHQAKAVHDQVPLPAVQLLAPVEGAAFLGAVRVGRLAIDAGRRPRGRLVLLADSLVQAVMNPPQRPVLVPLVEVVEDRLPRREVVWQHPPLTAAPRDVEDRVNDPPQVNLPRSSLPLQWRDQSLDNFPLLARRVCRVGFAVHTPFLMKNRAGRAPRIPAPPVFPGNKYKTDSDHPGSLLP